MLEGRQGEIKERTLGIEVFGRPADYEPVVDSIVRVNANEVRRRLSLYYRSFPHEPVRLELPRGSYIPTIHRVAPAVDSQAPTSAVSTEPPVKRRSLQALWISCAALAIAAAVAAVIVVRAQSHRDPMSLFWEPVIRSREAPIVRVPESIVYMFSKHAVEVLDGTPANATSVPIGPSEYRKVVGFHLSRPTFSAAWDIALFLQTRGRTALLRVGADLPAADLRRHPVIAVSSRPFEWAMTEAPDMRFSFRPIPGKGDAAYLIEDRVHPERGWRVESMFPFDAQTFDYALISRVFDRSTGNVSISASGLTSFGSQAAAEFLTNPDGWQAVAAKCPVGWEKRNLQIVLYTALVGRTPSPARVIAVHGW
jgi:hypothetical protein